MRTIVLAVAAACFSVIGALASLPPAEELPRGELLWSEEGDAEKGSAPLCSLPKPAPNIAMPTIDIYKSSRLQPTHGSNWQAF